MPNITTDHAITYTKIPRRYRICVVIGCLCSCRDDFPENLGKTTAQKNGKFSLPVDLLKHPIIITTTTFIIVTTIVSTKTVQQQQTTTTNFIENWKITNYITFPPANSL